MPENSLVVFDDAMLDKKILASAEHFFTRGRPMGLSCIFITQSYYEIPKHSIRENTNFLIMFKLDPLSLDSIIKNIASYDMPLEEFKRKMCKPAWAKNMALWLSIVL